MPWIDAHMQWYVDDETYAKLQSGEFERIGGIVRRADNKRVVKWLRTGRDLKDEDSGNPFFRIIAHRADLETLSDEELMEFARFIESSSSLSAASFYRGSRSAVSAILRKYDRLRETQDSTQYRQYAAEKRQSLENIFGRTYLPNLRLQVELGYMTLVVDEEHQLAELHTEEQST